MAAIARNYASVGFFLELDGVKCGFIKSVDGGSITAEVVNEPSGPDYYVKKHISRPKYEDFAIQLGFSMAGILYDWIAAAWNGQYRRQDGAIIAANFKLDAQSEKEFFNALVTETTIPACDGASKNPAYIGLKFAPEFTRTVKASGKLTAASGKSQQKLWQPANFRLKIDGLDCSKVNKVDAFTVKQTVTAEAVGEARDYSSQPGKLDFPPIKIHLAETVAQSWYAWHEDFVIKGNCDESREKTGTLTFLSADLKTELARISFFGLGLYKLTSDKDETGADQIRRVTAELYCERMEFICGGVK